MDPRQTELIDRKGIIPASALVDQREHVMQAAMKADLGPVFYTWLEKNWPIWVLFCQYADQMRVKGRKYYSARTIMEHVRWHRHISDSLDVTFKINDHWTPKLARTYNALVGFSFFETRESA